MIKKLFASLLMLICFLSVSMAQTCRDKNNMTIGKIESDGTVRNSSYMKIGSFDRNNVIRDASNMKVGSIDGGTIRDKNNMKIGSIESNGTVRDASNMKIGSVESNGTVRDGSNMKIGSVEGYLEKSFIFSEYLVEFAPILVIATRCTCQFPGSLRTVVKVMIAYK